MPSTAANVRFNASRMREHLLGDTSESGRSESSHSPSLEATLPPPHLVRDPCYRVCLVWRPVEEPPLPRCIHTASQALEGDAEATGYRDEPLACAEARRDASTSTAATALQLRSPPVKAQSPRKTIRARESPPRGQLLRRGKGGIDDVLRNAREAQRLFYTLQEHRLEAEYRRSQGSLRQELDQQRQYKRMVQLAEYQAELVNIFGHTMQDAVADSFFDDGGDSVLAALQRKRGEAPSTRSAFYSAMHRGHCSVAGSLGVGARRGSAERALPPAASTRESSVAQERHAFQRALEEVRGGRRCAY
ncbi:hypothetical_protein [Leishmania infantum]|nr:hypothetical_protein [Leishmania infantum]SUZ44999.1 hypothetical_protein [Leishmania infantum]